MKNLDLLEEYKIDNFGKAENAGVYKIPFKNKILRVIAEDSFGCEHISFLAQDIESCNKFTPTREEMNYIYNLFFNEGEVACEYHPKKSDYINLNENVLHLWRIKNYSCLPTFNKLIKKERLLFNLTSKKKLLIEKSLFEDGILLEGFVANGKGNKTNKEPSWNDLCQLKKKLFGEDVNAVSFFGNERLNKTKINIWLPKEELLLPEEIVNIRLSNSNKIK